MAFDLVSVTKSPIKITRWGQYPVPRGTMLAAGDSRAHLYTKGFVPELQTYPGSHVPSPFEILKARGDSTADFCCGVPITIGFARNVGEVFKKFDDSSAYDPSRFYRFYM